MKQSRSIPFYPNTKDDTHCYQAALRMVLKYFFPKRTFSYKQLDRVTEKKEGLWTWPIKGVLALRNMGIDVLDIESFDYEQFIEDPKGYLRREYGEEVAKTQIQHSDVDQAGIDAREAIRVVSIQKRIPTHDDIHSLLQKGWLLICLVNSQTLNRKKGYIGHFVVVWKYTDDIVFLHDPGLPSRKNRRVSKKVFEEAWAYPNAKAKGIMAFKLKENTGM